jgi:hypothetical protein
MKFIFTPVLLLFVAIAFAQNVGIGTNNPTAPLEVAGKIKSTSLQLTTGAGVQRLLTSDAEGNAFWIEPLWKPSGGNAFREFGNIGIGTTNPANRLHIVTIANGVAPVLRLENTANAQGVSFEMFTPAGQGLSPLVFKTKMQGYTYRIGASLNNGADYDIIMVRPKGQFGELTEGGLVGINLQGSLPVAPLHVRGTSLPQSQSTNMRYFNHAASAIVNVPNWTGSTAIFAEGNICATEAFISSQSFTFSDKRLKRIIGKSNSREDLDKLNQLEITRYQAADTFSNGSKVLTKVVAQQVSEIIPEAVAKTRGFLPNIMQPTKVLSYNAAQQTLMVTLGANTSLQPGDRLKIFDEQGREIHAQVKAVHDAYAFEIAYNGPSIQKAFIYGKEVPDVQMVDYEAISMLNVSATQELSKELESTRNELEMLKAQMRALQQMVQR